MYKELKALEHIYYGSQGYGETDKYYKYLKEFLEAIDNSNPSEALKDLKELHELAYGNGETSWKIDEIRMSSHIKQALIKSQEQEKVLEIIKEKNVDIFFIKSCKTLQIYNVEICKNSPFAYGLTQEEFDLLKRYLDNEH